jgi:methyl-galactoside transport system substrate-binding protein
MKHVRSTSASRAFAGTFIALSLAAASLLISGCDAAAGKPRIGVALHSVDDSFVSAARRALEDEAAGKAVVSVMDAQNQQKAQDDQISAMIADKAKALIVDPVDVKSVESLVVSAKASQVPIVLFSRDPSMAALELWDKAFFVGVKTEEAVRLQAEILADYCKSHQEADKDKDGAIEYVVMRTDSKQADANAASAIRQKAFDDASFRAMKLADIIADGTRTDARAKMDSLVHLLGASRVEAVLCSNDEMALGVLESLEVGANFNSSDNYVPVIGIDGTRFALDAIGDGSLLGTVRGDAASLGKAAFDLAFALATDVSPQSTSWTLIEGKYVLVPYQKVTVENYKDFK